MTTQILNVLGEGRVYPLLPLAARTATPNTFILENTQRNSAMVVVLGVTAITTAPSLTVTVSGYDPNSNTTWPILTSAVITAAGTYTLKIAQGIPATANASANDILPPNVQVSITHGNANSVTYALSAHVTN